MKKSTLLILLLATFTIVSCKEDKKCRTRTISDYATNGCGDFMVFKEISKTDSSSLFLIIEFERSKANLNDEFQTFDVTQRCIVNARIEELNSSNHNYCTDALNPASELLNSYEPALGNVNVRIVEDRNECNQTYVLDVELINASFIDSNSNTISIVNEAFKNVIVNYSIP